MFELFEGPGGEGEVLKHPNGNNDLGSNVTKVDFVGCHDMFVNYLLP